MADQSSDQDAKDQAGQASAPGGTVAPRPWRLRMALRVTFLLVVAPVLFLAIAAVLMIGNEVTAPSWVVRKVETRAEEALAGGSLDFRDIKVTVGDDLHPRIVLRNAVLRDRDGLVLARVPRVETLLSPRGALQGRALAQEVRLFGAQIDLRRRSDGSMAVAFGAGGSDVRSADTFFGLLEQVDSMFESGPLEALEQIRAEGSIINYSDARAGRSWTIDDGRIELDLRGGETVIRSSVALLAGRSYVTTAEMTYRSPRGSDEAELGVTITDAAGPDIASQSPALSFLGVLDAPISGAMRGSIDEEGALTRISATLQMGAGEVRPNAETRPIRFDGGQTYFSYEPARQKLTFDLIAVDSGWGRLTGAGHAYLREYEAGWPAAILGQISISELVVNPADYYPEPRDIGAATADFRLRLDPFTLTIGQAVLVNDGAPVRLSGDVIAAPDGWVVGLEAVADRLEAGRVLDLWPEALVPRTRQWVAENVTGGVSRNVAFGFRSEPDQPPRSGLTMEFEDMQVRYLREQPPMEGAAGRFSLFEKRLAISLDRGQVAAPEGGQVDLAGSQFVIPRTGPNAPAEIELALLGTITAALSLLSRPPFNVLRDSDLPVTLADGRMRAAARVLTPLGKDVEPADREWRVVADLSGVRSDVLIPERSVRASALALTADPESLVIRGPAQVGDATGRVVFSRALGPGSEGTSRIEAEVDLNQSFLNEFNIGLPTGTVSGQGTGALVLDLSDADTPGFRLSSNLNGIGLSLPALGWTKGRGSSGAFEVSGVLGQTPRIDRLRLNAAGLTAEGSLTLSPGGGLQRAGFDRVRIGDWLDAPVVLLGRGRGQPVGVQIAGGTLDLRRASFGTGGGEGGPMEVALDRLQISQGIALTEFRGVFSGQGGFSGEFSGLVNGTAPITGTLVPINGRSGVRILSANAGAVFNAAGLLRNARGGALDLTLRPAGAEGNYDGTLAATDLRVRDAPALASLLDAISVVGLLTQLDGQGLLFTDVDAQFRLTPDRIVLTQASAVGPGLGISLDGIYGLQSRTMDFQGVISPFYLLNGIGAVLTRPGEGLIGFNFNLQGSVDNPRVLVNPLSALTPGMFREIFRRPPPTVNQ